MGFFENMKKNRKENKEKKEQQLAERIAKGKIKAEVYREKFAVIEEKQRVLKTKIPVVLELIGGMSGLPKKVRIYRGLNDGEIKIEKRIVTLLTYQWGEKGERSVGKAATGAVIGSLIMPGIGTLVGGAMGSKKKDKSSLSLTVVEEGKEYQVLFRCDEDEFKEFTKRVIS